MPMPKNWKGSDGRARAEVCLWLMMHVDDNNVYSQDDGLITSRLKADLGKGRALSQLLADMERDGMIKREISGRRTLSIKLLDAWEGDLGRWYDDLRLAPEFRAHVVQPPSSNGEQSLEDTDLEALAEALLVKVIQRAHAPASSGAELERLREQVATFKAERDEARAATKAAQAETVEARRAEETMRQNLLESKKIVEKKPRGGTPIRDLLSERDRAELDKLMRAAPGQDRATDGDGQRSRRKQ